MHDAHAPLAEVVLISGSVFALAYGIAGSGHISTLVQESVRAVQVCGQCESVAAGSSHHINGHARSTDLYCHGVIGIDLGLKDFSELYGLRVGFVDKRAFPLGAVRIAVGIEEDENELVLVVVFPLDSDVAGLDGLSVDLGLVCEEAAVGLSGSVDIGLQIVLVACADKVGLQRSFAGERELEHAGGLHLGIGRLGERGQCGLLGLRVYTLKRVQLSGRAGDDGHCGHHHAVYE